VVIARLALLSTIALLLGALYLFVGGELTSASLPAPAQRSYSITENGTVDVTLAASHVDGLPGCTELTFTTANVTGGTLDALSNVSCAAGASLASDIDDTVNSIPVLSTTGFTGSTLRIDDEIIVYTSTTDTSFADVLRGRFGTAAASHSAGAVVSRAETQSALLDGPHSDLDKTITLVGIGLGFPGAGGVFQIEDEFMTYDSLTENVDHTDFDVVARKAFGSAGVAYACPPPDPQGACIPVYRSLSVSTALSAGIDSLQTEIPLDPADPPDDFADPEGSVQIDGELISYTGIGLTSGDCTPVAEPCLTGATRGVGSSVAAAHLIAANVFQLSGLDTDVATTTFTPGPGSFARTATLTEDITNSATTLPASTPVSTLPAIFPATGTLAVDGEIVSYTGVSTSAGTCNPVAPPCFTGVTRAVGGTAAAAHSTGAKIYQAFFTYTAGHNPTSAPIVVGVEVTPVNDPPITSDQQFDLQAPAPINVEIVATDLDGDSGEHVTGDCDLGFTVAISPANGALSGFTNTPCTSNTPNSDNVPNEDSVTVTYTPDDGFAGQDSFTVLICDDGTCVTATININLSAGSPGPTSTSTATASPGPSGSVTPVPSKTPVPPPLPYEFGDLDCDNDVDAVDALSILLKLAGFPHIVSDDPACPVLGGG